MEKLYMPKKLADFINIIPNSERSYMPFSISQIFFGYFPKIVNATETSKILVYFFTCDFANGHFFQL